jgi:hypothetical protein
MSFGLIDFAEYVIYFLLIIKVKLIIKGFFCPISFETSR